MAKKLQVGVAGLGRMGARHAINFHQRTPRAQVVAGFTPVKEEADWARATIEGITIYDDFDAMLKHPGLDAVVVATVSAVHAEEAIKAIQAGKHVLCEKPLSTSPQISQTVVDAADKAPHLKVMCGFSRRFDTSYRDAYARVARGDIGRPSVFRSQTCDRRNRTSFFVTYSLTSGGIFVDCNIHDIDLCLWFLGSGPGAQIKSVVASGIQAVHPELKDTNDADNAVGIIEFWGGRIAYFYSSRMMAAGQHDMTEIVGTEGKVAVNANPVGNFVEMHEATGIRREIPPDYWGRFEPAFVTEANEFTAACLDNTPLPFELSCSVRAVAIANDLQESLISGKKIYFDQDGKRLPEKA